MTKATVNLPYEEYEKLLRENKDITEDRESLYRKNYYCRELAMRIPSIIRPIKRMLQKLSEKPDNIRCDYLEHWRLKEEAYDLKIFLEKYGLYEKNIEKELEDER